MNYFLNVYDKHIYKLCNSVVIIHYNVYKKYFIVMKTLFPISIHINHISICIYIRFLKKKRHKTKH